MRTFSVALRQLATACFAQIQAQLGEGHVNIIAAQEVLLTSQHLAIGMEYASGGNLTAYVTSRWPQAQARSKMFLSEEEARFYFKVRITHRFNSEG